MWTCYISVCIYAPFSCHAVHGPSNCIILYRQYTGMHACIVLHVIDYVIVVFFQAVHLHARSISKFGGVMEERRDLYREIKERGA